MSRKLTFLLSIVLVATFVLSACAAPVATPAPAAPAEPAAPAAPAAFTGTVKIGTNLPMTGSVALNGQMILKGIQYAVKLTNDAGGINGKELVLDVQDDQGEPNQAATIANKFVADPTILAVIGNLKSSCTLAAAPIFNEGGLVTLSPDSSSPKVKDAGDWIFRVKNSDAINAKQAAQNAFADGHTIVGIFMENNDYGYGVRDEAKKELEILGAKVVLEETILTGEQTDFSTSISNLKNSGATAIILGVDYNESGLLMKQMQDAGLKLDRYGTDGLYTDALIQVGGTATEGTYALTSFHPSDPNPLVQNFIKDFSQWSGEAPNIFHAEGYDAAMVIIEAITKAGENRQAIRDYMSTMKYVGVIGDCTFDEFGEVNLPLKRVQIKDGKFVLVNP